MVSTPRFDATVDGSEIRLATGCINLVNNEINPPEITFTKTKGRPGFSDAPPKMVVLLHSISIVCPTVDGMLMEEILHQLIGSVSHYLQGFVHPRWLAGFIPSTESCLQLRFWLVLGHQFAAFFGEKVHLSDLDAGKKLRFVPCQFGDGNKPNSMGGLILSHDTRIPY